MNKSCEINGNLTENIGYKFNGETEYIGQFGENNKKSGFGMSKSSDKIYSGEYENGFQNGVGVAVWKEQISFARFLENFFDGYVMSFYYDGNVSEQNYVNRKKDGKEELINANGVKKAYWWKEGNMIKI